MILFSINVFTNALQSEFKNSVATPIKIFLGVVTDFCRAFVKSLMENKIIQPGTIHIFKKKLLKK